MKDLEMMPNRMKWKNFGFLIIIIVVGFWCSYFPFVDKRAKNAMKASYYCGIITKIHRIPVPRQRDMLAFDVQTEHDVIVVDVGSWWLAWGFANIGDSIIKPPDTLMITIKKPDGRSQDFFYQTLE